MRPEQFVFYLRGILNFAGNKKTEGLSPFATSLIIDALNIVEPRLPTRETIDEEGNLSDKITSIAT